MLVRYFASASALAVASVAAPCFAQSADEMAPPAQTRDVAGEETVEEISPDAETGRSNNMIIVTATRREESIQDVPLSISAFGQEELTKKGIVGFEGIGRETPGVVLNRPTQNFNNFTARGIATNGYNANLSSTVSVYIDELPVSTIGNTTVVDPNLFDVERVEFLRGPQGTLFGSGSLSGAMRIITKSPELGRFDASGLVDFGLTNDDSFRQRYNAMVNVPLGDTIALRAVGFYRNEDGYLDNVGTGIRNSNSLIDYGGRLSLLFQPTDRLSIKLLGSYENSDPKDSSLTSPSLGEEKRISDEPDRFTGEQIIANATIEYEFDFAKLTSSSTYSDFKQRFYVDLAGTFPASPALPGAPIAFGLDADAFDDVFVQETRLASTLGGPFEFVVGGFYLNRRRDVDFLYRSNPAFLAARGLTGLPSKYFQELYTYSVSEEIAAFGELTYRFSDKFWLTGGLRYGDISAQGFTEAGGFLATLNIPGATPTAPPTVLNYYTLALLNIRNVAFNTFTPYQPVEGVKARGSKLAYKLAASFKPVENITTYATIATGFRAPIVNAAAGRPSVAPGGASDIIIPPGASSDDLKSYEIGAKATWLDGKVTANFAAYYIDWSNIQVQANRVTDSVQFATNIGAAVSKGFEFELGLVPASGWYLGVNGAYNDAKITELTPSEAAISGAVLGHRLSAPRLQGAAFLSYTFDISDDVEATLATNAQYIGDFNSSFPNQAGNPKVRLATFGVTDNYANVNVSFGIEKGDFGAQLYVENLFDDHSVTYIHPEAFLVSRFGTMRPRTFGIRLSYGI